MSPRTLAMSAALVVAVAVLGWQYSSATRYQPVAPAGTHRAAPVAAPRTPRQVEVPGIEINEPFGRIVFTSYRDYNASGIFAMQFDGSDVTSLTLGGSAAGSPDGSLVACNQFYLDTNCFEIVLLDAEGNLLQRLTETPEEDSTCPAWSPDGLRIVFQSGDFNKSGIYVMNADGTGRRALTPPLSNDRHPCWSPSGNRIAFSSYRDGSQGVYVMDAEGGQLRRLTDTDSSCGEPAWSPTSTHIACVAYDRSSRSYSLRVVDPETGDWWNVIEDQEQITGPDWSPAGDWLAFSMSANDQTDIYIVDICGGGLKNLTNEKASDRDPSWTY